ncbi:hypothetical protein A3D71_00860 [Candidatus Kaiserbacteria bacterium RIFCSPHIGHO2_02_FULL_55_20]|uniref:Uncharacterized protein n=1 Tax=Candidatus Kaiserbacteria bacterium RIFCSPHIGHO2_02_FULL_55_20 TaxID=1798497 RepID=A0A1F6DWB7_9BACT|nr:MAG: hypothetical protein A2680_02550 [Candidatus Kaiserbacteria bacterium RIFCSPHIGHO2_01_FULL_55_37]OGG65711.1 MAG: hypothetical protein A3D71_00860 [Candidatus Kaiserbacteria bacterium RIFCSPHIGHO2_02_FULL_55_20]
MPIFDERKFWKRRGTGAKTSEPAGDKNAPEDAPPLRDTLEKALTEPAMDFSGMFPPLNDVGPDVQKYLNVLIQEAAQHGVKISSGVEGMLMNKDFFEGIPDILRNDRQRLLQYITNSSRFHDLIHTARKRAWSGDSTGLLGKEVEIQGIVGHAGKERRKEAGLMLNLEYLRSIGIDPSKVLFFRRTDPGEADPRPERYWTSDYGEALDGLTAEIGYPRRASTIVLVADLQTIEVAGHGLIQDINDDSGISVCQITNNPFNQREALAVLKDPRLTRE